MKPPQSVRKVADETSDLSEQKNKTMGQMFAGGLAGSVGKTITAPLSRLTILYQVSPLLASASPTKQISAQTYSSNMSLYSACKRIIKNEGVLAFWKGNLTSVLHRFPYSAINFASYEMSKDILVNKFQRKESPELRFGCGAIAGAVACFACYPLDLVRTRLTVSASSSSSSSPRLRIYQTLVQVIREEGIFGLYRGLLISLAVSVPNLAIGFSVYGSMKERCLNSGNNMLVHTPKINTSKNTNSNRNKPSLTPLGCMASGAVSGILSSLVTFPADTVRRRMQVRGLVNKHGGSMTEGVRILRHEGAFGLYRGILPELLKVTPMVGVTFMTYEFVNRCIEEPALLLRGQD